MVNRVNIDVSRLSYIFAGKLIGYQLTKTFIIIASITQCIIIFFVAVDFLNIIHFTSIEIMSLKRIQIVSFPKFIYDLINIHRYMVTGGLIFMLDVVRSLRIENIGLNFI